MTAGTSDHTDYRQQVMVGAERVPRVATSTDDLRARQLVAVISDDFTGVLEVSGLGSESFVGVTPGDVPSKMYPGEHVSIGGSAYVCILRDAPAPPVTVRREDYDRLRRAGICNVTALSPPGIVDAALAAARALIANAEVPS